MRLNSKLTWGLAWTGLAVVLAVPSADYITGRLGGGDSAAVLTSDVEPVKTAAVTPVEPAPVKTVTTIKTKNGISIVPAGSTPPAGDPVDKLLGNGKPLPDYISDGDTPAMGETQAASLPEPAVAPTPFPSWARPKAAPAPTIPSVTAPATTTSPEPVVIVDGDTMTGSIALPESTGPGPPAPIVDDSQNWDTEGLRDYLERRGILEGGNERSTATVTERSTTYDPDGFYLNEGPNGDRMTRETRRQRLERLFEESGDDPDSFTLF
jgi:hypothetical protein